MSLPLFHIFPCCNRVKSANPMDTAYILRGGEIMNAQDYWQLFLETGAPELYLLYTKAAKTEGVHVPDCSGHRFESNGLQ